jgi:diguanylate cyclase (GGDEF)-like protein
MPHDTSIPPRQSFRRKRRLSLRSRLILVALLAVVPLMLDRVRVLEVARTENIAAATTEAINLAKRGAEAQIEVVNSTKALLELVARGYLTLTAAHQDCSKFLADFAADIPWVKGFSVVGPDDRIICSTRPSAVGLNVSDRDYVAAARETRGFVLSDYLMSRAFDQPAIIAAYSTLAKGGKTDAVIIAPLDLDWVGHLADSIGKRAGASIFLIDGKGTVLTGLFNRDNIIGHNFIKDPLIQEALSRDDGNITTAGLDGIRRIFAFKRLPGTDTRVVVGFEEREVLSRVDREFGIAYLELFLFGAFTLLVSWIGGEKLIVQPIRALARNAARIGRGELDVRCTPENWAAEFVPLAAALDEMAVKLASRERELRSTNLQLAELASIDSLSGLANRRSFDARLLTEWQRAEAVRQPIGLLMIDVDHFKLFNDRYGHLEGDSCLKLVGEILTSAIQDEGDFAARYGGEEFVILLRSASVLRAQAFAEQLRQKVEAQRIVNQAAPIGYITVSIGVASRSPQNNETPQALVEAADACLYEAKRRGRNVVVTDLAALSKAS